jgi:hypothetical protein
MMLLHFVSLEHNKMFLHMTISTEWTDIVQECRDYEYCRQHLPLRSLFSMTLHEDSPYLDQVDEIVQQFRDLFGEDNTCGGSMPTAESHLLESIETESTVDPYLSQVRG